VKGRGRRIGQRLTSDAAMLDAMISENSAQGGTNFPSALDGVAAAIRFIAQVFLSDDDSNAVYTALLSSNESGVEQIRSKMIASSDIGHVVIGRYFQHSISKTIKRDIVGQALAALDDAGHTKRIVLAEIKGQEATQAKDNAPSASDAVAAAVKFICKVLMDGASNSSCTIAQSLFDGSQGIGTVRSDLISNQRLGRPVVLKYFDSCVKRTIGRREVEATLKNLEASGILAHIALEAITSA
jgi:hypothetical protein